MTDFLKALELAARYAWAAFLVAIFLLEMPDELALRLGLQELRGAHKSTLSLVLLFSLALIVTQCWRQVVDLVWRFGVCPLKKILLPVSDARTGVKQSRVRYYKAQFQFADRDPLILFEAINSNGYQIGFFDEKGRRAFPQEPNLGYVRIDQSRFHQPPWGRIDWSDVFNGDLSRGMWGIVER